MIKNLSKTEAKKIIEKFFKNIKDKNPKEVKKIKRFAMRYNILLKEKRKLFCKKCYVVFNAKNSETRIKKGKKIIRCLNCKNINRWKAK